jgi:glycosyltransferase involved in cell wall biosynthesis
MFNSNQAGSDTPIGVMVKCFPKLSETFILGEIAGLVDIGRNVRIISLNKPVEKLRQPASKALINRVSYMGELSLTAAIRVWAEVFVRKPIATVTIVINTMIERGSLRFLAEYVHICSLYEIKHVHVHYISAPAKIAADASKLCNVSFSISAHAKDIYTTPVKQLQSQIHSARFVATCTETNRRYLAGIAAVNHRKIHLIYHGIDSTHFSFRPDKCTSNKLRILAIGRFKEKKGFDVLIDACAMLKRQGLVFQCEIVGYGDQTDRLKRQIEMLMLDDEVHLCKPVDHSVIVNFLHKATVFVMPSRKAADGDVDGIPNAMLEAMACGVAVVGTRVSGIPEVVKHLETGMLVQPDSSEALAKAIQRLAMDHGLRAKLGRLARQKIVEQFSWRYSIDSLNRLFDQTCEEVSIGGMQCETR